VSATGERRIPLEKFFVGPGKSVLKFDEILTEIQIPASNDSTGTSFLKIGRTASDLAKISVAVALALEDGVCVEARVALGAVSPTPIRAKKAERVLKDSGLDDETVRKAARIAAEETNPITDVRSTIDYRKEESEVLVRRAVKNALERLYIREMRI
jgi:carbon-monoxide dehydrogenase medium subunit